MTSKQHVEIVTAWPREDGSISASIERLPADSAKDLALIQEELDFWGEPYAELFEGTKRIGVIEACY